MLNQRSRVSSFLIWTKESNEHFPNVSHANGLKHFLREFQLKWNFLWTKNGFDIRVLIIFLGKPPNRILNWANFYFYRIEFYTVNHRVCIWFKRRKRKKQLQMQRIIRSSLKQRLQLSLSLSLKKKQHDSLIRGEFLWIAIICKIFSENVVVSTKLNWKWKWKGPHFSSCETTIHCTFNTIIPHSSRTARAEPNTMLLS